MNFSFHYYAAPSELFAPEAAESMIGKTFVAKLFDEELGVGRILEAQLEDGGRAILVKVEWPGELDLSLNDSISFGTD